MRWLKHMTDTSRDEKVAELISRAGHEAYGLWWMVLETIAAGMDKHSEKCSLRYPISKWAAELQLLPQNVCRQLAVIGAVGLLEIHRDGAMLELSAPNLLKYRDEYSRKSGHSPDTVRSKKQIQNTDTDTEAEGEPAPVGAAGVLPFPEPISEDDLIAETAKRICARHPGPNGCGPAEARKHLKAIVGKLPKAQRAAKLEQIDHNHEEWSRSEQWTKDSGQYARGLANWLAPTMGRYDQIPQPRASPARTVGVPNPQGYFDPRSITG